MAAPELAGRATIFGANGTAVLHGVTSFTTDSQKAQSIGWKFSYDKKPALDGNGDPFAYAGVNQRRTVTFSLIVTAAAGANTKAKANEALKDLTSAILKPLVKVTLADTLIGQTGGTGAGIVDGDYNLDDLSLDATSGDHIKFTVTASQPYLAVVS